MKRILHVYPQLNCGGTEMVIYNLIKFGNHAEYKFDLLVQCPGDNESIFRELGCEIHYVENKDIRDYAKCIREFFNEHHFDIIHTHMHIGMDIVLREAEITGIAHRIAHSHNARIDLPRWIWPIRYFRNHSFEKYATDLFGCSALALKWLFPTRWKSGHVIYNGIDMDKFRFNSAMRAKYRQNSGIDDRTRVFVNTGRCTNQKNQFFILDLAQKCKDKDYIFIIIGDGPLYADLKKQCEERHLSNVRLLGKCDDVARWLCAADAFLFPSIYEGLGIVAIEAQASGLPVIAADTIPAEADMELGTFHHLSLRDTEAWLAALDTPILTDTERSDCSTRAFATHYNIHNTIKAVEEIYSKEC